MMPLWTKLCSSLRAFRLAHAGNVAITFAFATLPLITFVGFAVDYSRANSVKAALQSALDSTSLMLSKEASTDSPADLASHADTYFKALFTRTEAKNIQTSVKYDTVGGSSVVISASADVPTYLLGLLPGQMFQTLTVSSSATAKWGLNRLRVALVLDNTGSMADSGKMAAIQSATATSTGSLLNQLKGAASANGDVYVSIVPFVKDVNLGAANWNSDYIYWGTAAQDPTLADNTSWDANNGTCSFGGSNKNTRSKCLAQASFCSISGFTTQSTCTAAGTCSIAGNNDQTSCINAAACSISGITNQSTCTSSGVCSISGRSTESSCTTASCSIAGYTTQNTCTAAGACSNPGITDKNTCTNNKACNLAQYTTKTTCQSGGGSCNTGRWTSGIWNAAGTWTTGVWSNGVWTPGVWTSPVWTPKNHSVWNGCVVDRGGPTAPDPGNYDTNVVAPDTAINATLYAAEQYSSCPQPVMGLSYDWTAMNTLVTNMTPAGNTNQAIGLQLGWLSLVGGGPFSVPPLDPNYNYTQAVILLTDGLNTQDRWYSSQGSIDTRQQKTCDNLNAAGITVYTIQVNTG